MSAFNVDFSLHEPPRLQGTLSVCVNSPKYMNTSVGYKYMHTKPAVILKLIGNQLVDCHKVCIERGLVQVSSVEQIFTSSGI